MPITPSRLAPVITQLTWTPPIEAPVATEAICRLRILRGGGAWDLSRGRAPRTTNPRLAALELGSSLRADSRQRIFSLWLSETALIHTQYSALLESVRSRRPRSSRA